MREWRNQWRKRLVDPEGLGRRNQRRGTSGEVVVTESRTRLGREEDTERRQL